MDVFVQKFVAVSHKKIAEKNCSEIHFVGTTLQFPFLDSCENLQIQGQYSINIKEIKAEIDSVKKSSKTIIIKNGEPCLQSLAVKSLCKYIKENSLFVEIETYGTKPNVLRELIERKLVDIITLKIYCPISEGWIKKLSKDKLINDSKSMASSIKQSINIIKQTGIKVYVKTIVVPSFMYRKSDLVQIAKIIQPIKKVVWEIMPFKPENCSKYFMNIKEPSEKFMEEMKAELSKEFPEISIR